MMTLLDNLNAILWGYLLVYLLIGTGLFFTIRTRFVQVRLFWRGVKEMLAGFRGRGSGSISPFQAFATGMASRVGTGNILGVAMAISIGGPGAVFWMWVTALVGMSSTVIECTLAQVFKESAPNGGFRGGPAYYIQKGLGRHGLAVAFAVSLLVAFGFVFNAIQSNSISSSLEQTYSVPAWLSGLFLVALTAPIIFGGARKVGIVAEFMVPVMAGFYLLLAGGIVVSRWSEVPAVISLIVQSAFGFGPAAAGFAGYTLAQGMTLGTQRGLFSNEAGMGSAPNAAASATTDHPVTQGLLQMFGVFVDTILVCSATAFMILLSGVFVPGQKIGAAALTQAALAGEVGAWSSHFLALAIFLFAFSSIIGNYAYAEANVSFLRDRPRAVAGFRMLVLCMVYFGAVAKVELVWKMGDLSQAAMALINLTAILALSGVAFRVLRDYERQMGAGCGRPSFSRDLLPEFSGTLPEDVWPSAAQKPEREHGSGPEGHGLDDVRHA